MRYSKAKQMKHIQALAFTVHETVLYLDGHPKCQKALAHYHKYNEMLKEALAEYEAAYGPLTQNGNDSENCWNWVKGPWPWQYEANFCEGGK